MINAESPNSSESTNASATSTGPDAAPGGPVEPGDEWIADAVARLPGAGFAYKPEWDSWVMWVGGKMFGMRGSHASKGELLTLKGDPDDNEALRQEFDAIEPGYYANKRHWNSVLLDRKEVPRARAVQLIEDSYDLVFASLPKRVRLEIGEVGGERRPPEPSASTR